MSCHSNISINSHQFLLLKHENEFLRKKTDKFYFISNGIWPSNRFNKKLKILTPTDLIFYEYQNASLTVDQELQLRVTKVCMKMGFLNMDEPKLRKRVFYFPSTATFLHLWCLFYNQLIFLGTCNVTFRNGGKQWKKVCKKVLLILNFNYGTSPKNSTTFFLSLLSHCWTSNVVNFVVRKSRNIHRFPFNTRSVFGCFFTFFSIFLPNSLNLFSFVPSLLGSCIKI